MVKVVGGPSVQPIQFNSWGRSVIGMAHSWAAGADTPLFVLLSFSLSVASSP